MSIASEITRILNAKADIKSAIEEKGVAVGDDSIDTYAEKISEISSDDGGSYEQGKRAAQEEFWEDFLSNRDSRKAANDGSYMFAFWNEAVFYPTQDIKLRNASRAFYAFNYNVAEPVDLIARFKECGVELDTKNLTTCEYMFGNARVLTVPTIDLRTRVAQSAMFNNATLLKVIEKLILREDGNNTFTTNMFNCKALEEVRFEGVFGNDISFQYCPLLSKESLLSILAALKDYSGTTTTKTLTLHADSKAKLNDEEKAIATRKGWTLL